MTIKDNTLRVPFIYCFLVKYIKQSKKLKLPTEGSHLERFVTREVKKHLFRYLKREKMLECIRPFQPLENNYSLGTDDIGRYMMFGYVYKRNSAPNR